MNNSRIYHKVILSILFVLITTISSWAQQSEGVIRYLVTGNWVKIMAATDYLSQEKKDRVSYVWGNNAEWKAYCTLSFNGQQTKYEESDEKADSENEGYSWRQDEYFIYRDLEKRNIRDIIKLLGKVYIIEDTLVAQPWKILNDIKEVSGHICMNATWTDTVRDQKIIAWFALDIPISSGPERYCGLPGMILEIDVNDGAKVISANRIEYISTGTALDFPKKVKGKHIKDAVYENIIAKYISDKKALEEFWWGIRY